MPRLLRLPSDVGLLTNKRMAVEVGVGLAHLSGRTLSMPLQDPIGQGPGGILHGRDAGKPSTVADLFEIPVPVVDDKGWRQAQASRGVERLLWPTFSEAVFVADDADADSPLFGDFANGRSQFVSLGGRLEEVPNLEITARPLTWYTYFFYTPGADRPALFDIMAKVRAHPEYREFAGLVARALGDFNAVHIRRTDILRGIPASREVTPWQIAANLAEVLPVRERLVVCSEADGASAVFGPLKDTFPETLFLTEHLLEPPWRADFMSLPSHDDHALGLVTQEVAALADKFVGTIGSTFTGAIQRARVLRDPHEPFLFVADYTPPGPQFEKCAFQEIHAGRFTWNRIGYGMSPDVLGWFRDWPESNSELWPTERA